MAWSLAAHPGLSLLLPHYRRHLVAFVWGFLLLAATSLTSAAIPYLMKLATDALTDPLGETGYYALALMALALINALLRIRSRTHVYRIGREVEFELRRDYHHHLLWMDAPFFDRSRTGDLVSRGTNDILAIRMFIGPGFLQVSNTVMAYGVTLPVMLGLDPMLTLVALAPYPFVLILARLLTRRLYQLSRQVADRFGELTSTIQESLSGLPVIRNHGQEDRWEGHFRTRLDILYDAHAHHTQLQSLFSPMMMFSGTLSGLFILGYGGHEVAAGRLTVGDFVAFSGYLALLIWPTIGLGWILTVLQRGLAALDRLHQVVSLPTLQHGSREETPPPRWRGHISVRHQNFSYPGREGTVLKDISLEIPPGSFVGLVGRVGCGKSALLNSLARLYPVPDNTIYLDGQELNTLPESHLRANLTMAPQESFLFSIPMLDNLLYGCHNQEESTAWQLAERVALADEIRHFPKAMHTLVGERGITLSGGQRQRVALARALAMNTPIVLLDDIFSSVDARTEATILQHLFHDTPHRPTVVMVCHRVAALHQAEVIYLMEEGRIVAQGSHQFLLQTSPLYQELHQRMARAEALESLQ